MKITNIAKTEKHYQDGAVFGKLLFRLDGQGNCIVYELPDYKEFNGERKSLPEYCRFVLDRAEEIRPHSNSVMFSGEYFAPGDEFPLLYTNIYNNYAWAEDKMVGVCLVYRIERDADAIKSTLVQMIRIGFTENCDYWKSSEDSEDVRPYGNFVVDKENKKLWAFTMRDKADATRYFCFDLPDVTDGEDYMGIKQVVLESGDIKKSFDCEYHRFLQGATLSDGKIYSLEGFDHDPVNLPAMRIIDIEKGVQEQFIDLSFLGIETEPEFIDYEDGVWYYGDNGENFYVIEF